MKKWILLGLITAVLIITGLVFKESLPLTESYLMIVGFFAIQTLVLFRIDQWAPEEWKVQVSMVKIVLRLLSSLVFIAVLLYTQDEQFNIVVEFIIIYLIFMIFEIVEALTNLRRN